MLSHSIASPYSHALTVYYTPLANAFSYVLLLHLCVYGTVYIRQLNYAVFLSSTCSIPPVMFNGSALGVYPDLFQYCAVTTSTTTPLPSKVDLSQLSLVTSSTAAMTVYTQNLNRPTTLSMDSDISYDPQNITVSLAHCVCKICVYALIISSMLVYTLLRMCVNIYIHSYNYRSIQSPS